MKKFLTLFVTMLQVFCLAGACGVQYFTRKKMGMARYVIYKNREWEAAYPMENLLNITAVLMVVLTLAAFFFFLKRKPPASGGLWLTNAAMLVFTAAYAGFIWYSSVKTLRAYYMIGAILSLAVLLQIVKTAVGTLMWKYEA